MALCDNENQGIVPVPSFLGNGKDPARNLYWGALYGVKTFFRNSKDWELQDTIETPNKYILERCVFSAPQKNAIIIADAYDGAVIKNTIIDFLNSSAGMGFDTLVIKDDTIFAGGSSDLIAYVGHDGLMEFDIHNSPQAADSLCRDVIILACMSKQFFSNYIEEAGACPLLWTTGLMAPEAYTLYAAIESWLNESNPEGIRQKAAEAYDKYQNCGLNAARRLLVTGK